MEDDVAFGLSTARVIAKLTPRQRRVLAGLHAGYCVAELATALDLPRDTVNEDRRRIREPIRAEGLFLRD